jgi:hypothetical protein
MSPILSAILISSFSIIFFSFVSTKIDQLIKWNWFVVFIPMFFLKFCFLIDCIVLMIKNRTKSKYKIIKLSIFLLSILLALIFELLICFKLESYNLKLSVAFTPFWLLCFILFGYLLIKLYS